MLVVVMVYVMFYITDLLLLLVKDKDDKVSFFLQLCVYANMMCVITCSCQLLLLLFSVVGLLLSRCASAMSSDVN